MRQRWQLNPYPTSSSSSKRAWPFATLSTSPVLEALLNRIRWVLPVASDLVRAWTNALNSVRKHISLAHWSGPLSRSTQYIAHVQRTRSLMTLRVDAL